MKMNRLRNTAIAIGIAGTLALSSIISKCSQPDIEPIRKPSSAQVLDGGQKLKSHLEMLKKSKDGGSKEEKSVLTEKEKELLDFYCQTGLNLRRGVGTSTFNKFILEAQDEEYADNKDVEKDEDILDEILGGVITPKRVAWSLIKLLENASDSDYACDADFMRDKIVQTIFDLTKKMPLDEAIEIVFQLFKNVMLRDPMLYHEMTTLIEEHPNGWTADIFKQIFEYTIADGSVFLAQSMPWNLKGHTDLNLSEIQSFLESQLRSDDIYRSYTAAEFMHKLYYTDEFGDWINTPEALDCYKVLEITRSKISEYEDEDGLDYSEPVCWSLPKNFGKGYLLIKNNTPEVVSDCGPDEDTEEENENSEDNDSE